MFLEYKGSIKEVEYMNEDSIHVLNEIRMVDC